MTYVLANKPERLLWEHLTRRHLDVIALRSDSSNTVHALGETTVKLLADVSLFVCHIPLDDFKGLKYVHKWVLVDCYLVHFNLN